jgi:hypothetical protein
VTVTTLRSSGSQPSPPRLGGLAGDEEYDKWSSALDFGTIVDLVEDASDKGGEEAHAAATTTCHPPSRTTSAMTQTMTTATSASRLRFSLGFFEYLFKLCKKSNCFE